MASSLLTLLGTCLLMVAEAQAAVQDFGVMIKYLTGRSPFSYLFYGCYCGIGGSGQPVDDIDWCCHAHDCCYGVVEKMGGSPLTQKYKYTIIYRTITCDDEDLDGLARKTCECDREAAICFQIHNNCFSRKNSRNYLRRHCNGAQPPCKC
ncbi:group IIE secretory phospholipase A2-like [Engystomops pustulosus]|uniref:group IIE secretory phospholipase A2-like n=1 Tax=Engystomops pustulosus TaxID=76066 RepID=UPI003AFB4FD6